MSKGNLSRMKSFIKFMIILTFIIYSALPSSADAKINYSPDGSIKIFCDISVVNKVAKKISLQYGITTIPTESSITINSKFNDVSSILNDKSSFNNFVTDESNRISNRETLVPAIFAFASIAFLIGFIIFMHIDENRPPSENYF